MTENLEIDPQAFREAFKVAQSYETTSPEIT